MPVVQLAMPRGGRQLTGCLLQASARCAVRLAFDGGLAALRDAIAALDRT